MFQTMPGHDLRGEEQCRVDRVDRMPETTWSTPSGSTFTGESRRVHLPCSVALQFSIRPTSMDTHRRTSTKTHRQMSTDTQRDEHRHAER